MSDIAFFDGKFRSQAYEKLKVFLANPGKFCLIVIGSRGTGKHFALESAFKEITQQIKPERTNKTKQERDIKELCLQNLSFIHPDNIPDNIIGLNTLLKENEYNTIVIEDVEELTDEKQKLLFKALSTSDGTFGVGENINLRIAFTSSKDIGALRTDKDLLLGIFWDRISQLIVEMPSYKKDGSAIVKDFYSTWKKMKFENTIGYEHLSAIPKVVNLEMFLENNSEKFEGGFRDLDKIACLYFNYRILHYGNEKKILEKIERIVVESVRDDFFSKSQMHGDTGNDEDIYRFEVGLSHQELLGRYKMQLRKWAVKEYGTIAKAEKKLGFKPGSMKNYVQTKVTKQAKAKEIIAKK